MSYSAIQNYPIFVNLVEQTNYTGWSVDGVIATHSSCQSGNIDVIGYPIVAGHAYTFTYEVITISGGNVQPYLGGTAGPAVTTTGLKTVTITAATDDDFYFYSNANCTIQAFTINDTTPITTTVPTNTLAFADKLQKWTSFYTFVPDCGTALFNRTIQFNSGNMYIQQNGTNNRCNFFGTQYASVFKFVENSNPTLLKSFNSIALQSNELMVTTNDGITTSLGQVSELAAQDFIKGAMSDSNSQVNIYAAEGIYSASFLRDSRFDLINGDPLQGNYIVIELISENNSAVLQLFTVAVNSSRSSIGVR